MAEKSQLCLTDFFAGQDPGQYQIQHRDAVMQTAGRLLLFLHDWMI